MDDSRATGAGVRQQEESVVPHPIIVDFAVALLITSVAFDVLASIVEERDLRVVSWWTLMLGTVAASLSVVSGYAAATLAGNETRVAETVVLHRNLGLTTLVCFSICALWRVRHPATFPQRHANVYWALATIGLGALVVTAYFGGILVFRLGVGYLPPS